MKYFLRKANENDYELLKSYKRHSIFDYAHDLDPKEEKRINDYIEGNLKCDDYVIIYNDEDVMGAYLVDDEKHLLDEIYIEEKYRHQGLGSILIKEMLNKDQELCLWVYKENKNAIRLYESLGFKVQQETDTRLFMKFLK